MIRIVGVILSYICAALAVAVCTRALFDTANPGPGALGFTTVGLVLAMFMIGLVATVGTQIRRSAGEVPAEIYSRYKLVASPLRTTLLLSFFVLANVTAILGVVNSKNFGAANGNYFEVVNGAQKAISKARYDLLRSGPARLLGGVAMGFSTANLMVYLGFLSSHSNASKIE